MRNFRAGRFGQRFVGAAIAGTLGGLVLMTGCAPMQPARPGEPRPGPVGRVEAPAPSYAEVAEVYNRRAGALESLWARTVVRFWYPDEQGREQQEQAEGHLQYVRPRNVNLSLMKVGEPVGSLGSNETQYWWIERGRGAERRAHVGEHALATPERIARLGLPMFPLDVIELVGVTPLPTDVPTSGPGSPSVRYGPDRRELIVNIPIEGGVRRQVLDPETLEPIRIEVVDGEGALRLVSELSAYSTVQVRGAGPEALRPRMPGEIVAAVNDGRTRVRLRLFEPETGGNRPRAAAFNLEALFTQYGVRREHVINVDEQPVANR